MPIQPMTSIAGPWPFRHPAASGAASGGASSAASGAASSAAAHGAGTTTVSDEPARPAAERLGVDTVRTGARPRTRTLACLGSKGGTGTTVIATSLAWALAQHGQRVLLLDLHPAGGQAALHLCEQNAGPTMREVLWAIERLDSTLLDTLLTPCGPGLRLLPSPRERRDDDVNLPMTPQALNRLMAATHDLADVVLIDLPTQALQHPGLAAVVAQAHTRVMVSEPSLSATFNARRMLTDLLNLDAPPDETDAAPTNLEFVLNKIGPHDALSPLQIRRTLGLDGHARGWRELPRRDATVAQATYQGLAVGQLHPRDPLARALGQWAQEWSEAWVRERPADEPVSDGLPGSAARTWQQLWQRWAS